MKTAATNSLEATTRSKQLHATTPPPAHSQGETLESAEAGGEAVVVGDHHGGIERLEVQQKNGVLVEPGLGLQDQGNALVGCHSERDDNDTLPW